jgi:2,4-dienoyl-CoA reductase (NADPH2)
VIERSGRVGGVPAVTGPGRPLVTWLAKECERLGVAIDVDVEAPTPAPTEVLVQCTGSQPGRRTYEVAPDAVVLDALAVRYDTAVVPPEGPVVVFDPIGGPIGVAMAEELGDRAVLVTHDYVAGNELARTGDLAPANVRLQQRGVRIERRTLVRAVGADGVEVEDRFSGKRRVIPAVAVIDCGHRWPDEAIPGAALRAGDCVAPRSIHEAILEGRRAALTVDSTA